MDESDIRALLNAGLGECDIQVQLDGARLGVIIVAAAFEGLSRVKRQQLVYGLLNDKIGSGEIHAVSMKCLSPAEQRSA